jgi:hypothetical protein
VKRHGADRCSSAEAGDQRMSLGRVVLLGGVLVRHDSVSLHGVGSSDGHERATFLLGSDVALTERSPDLGRYPAEFGCGVGRLEIWPLLTQSPWESRPTQRPPTRPQRHRTRGELGTWQFHMTNSSASAVGQLMTLNALRGTHHVPSGRSDRSRPWSRETDPAGHPRVGGPTGVPRTSSRPTPCR